MTNQASEDEPTVEQILYGFGLFSRWYGFDEALDTKGKHTSSTPTEAIDKAKEAIEGLIRTEKLKLLAEVRERVVGEDLPTYGPQNENGDISEQDYLTYGANDLRAEQRIELTKLEAEL